MSKSGFRTWLDKMFPVERRGSTNEFVDRSLEALRLVRDERAFNMGNLRRVPSRLELRIAQERYDELAGMQATRDLEYFFTDELMKDLAAESMRTFGEHAVRVTIAVDSTLASGEIYAVVLSPESTSAAPERAGGPGAIAEDSTRVLGGDAAPATVVLSRGATVSPHCRLVVTGPDGYEIEETLTGPCWVLGRTGSSGRGLPPGCRKLDLDVRGTVSREQVRLELFDDHLTIERIGKAPVVVSNGDLLGDGDLYRLSYGEQFRIDLYECTISRQEGT